MTKNQILRVQPLLLKLPYIKADLSMEIRRGSLTKTNLQSSIPGRFLIYGYFIFRMDRAMGRRKSGGKLFVYVKTALKPRQYR